MSITYDIVSSKIYRKHDYSNFEIVNFPFLGGDDGFNNRNLFLTDKLLKQGYQYHKICKAIPHGHSEFIVKYNKNASASGHNCAINLW